MNSDTAQSLRLFYALWPDDETRAALAKLQTAIPGRKTSYTNLHLTLVFLGSQPIAALPELENILLAIPRIDMTLVLDRIGYFTKSRIAWTGTHAIPDALFELHRHLKKELAQRSIAVDTRSAFKPHVTLARDSSAPDDIPFEPIRWHANRVCLVASYAEADGVRYQALASKCW